MISKLWAIIAQSSESKPETKLTLMTILLEDKERVLRRQQKSFVGYLLVCRAFRALPSRLAAPVRLGHLFGPADQAGLSQGRCKCHFVRFVSIAKRGRTARGSTRVLPVLVSEIG